MSDIRIMEQQNAWAKIGDSLKSTMQVPLISVEPKFCKQVCMCTHTQCPQQLAFISAAIPVRPRGLTCA